MSKKVNTDLPAGRRGHGDTEKYYYQIEKTKNSYFTINLGKQIDN